MENKTKLINGDALEIMDKMIEEGTKVDLVITDPPYKLTARGSSGTMGGEFWKSDRAKKGDLFKAIPDIKDWIDKIYELLNEGTHAYIMTNDKNLLHYLTTIKESKFKFVKTIIWNKPNKITGRWYMTKKETIILIRKGKARPINNAGTPDVIETPTFRKQKTINEQGKTINIHDTEKPVELMKILVENSSNEGEIVFDPFMGAGSTGVAAIGSNRKFIGTEIDDKYFNFAQKEINKTKEKNDLHSS